MIAIAGFFSWVIIIPIVFSLPLIEILVRGSTQITMNGSLETYTRETIMVPFLFALVPTLFVLIVGFPLVKLAINGIRNLKKDGPWYAGTNSHLIEIQDDTSQYYSWKDFDSHIETKSHKEDTLDIMLQYKKDLDSSNENEEENLLINAIQLTVNGKSVDPKKLFSSRVFGKNKIGLLGLKNGSYILNMIRHNMERMDK